jgi:hypothetical protein
VKISGSPAPLLEIPVVVKREIKADPAVSSSIKLVTANHEPRMFQSNQLAALALPQDRLSAVIIELARFFSLPLEPGLLSKIRRETRPSNEQAAKPETLSLAAAAAADKGVELSAAALKKYAQALSLDPEQENGPKEENKPETNSRDLITLVKDTAELKNFILQTAEQNPLLRLLNWLPGRNGQRWLVLPFKFAGQGAEYSACIKIMLNGADAAASGQTGLMALEIAKTYTDKSPKSGLLHRQLFIMDSRNGKKPRLRIFQSDTGDKEAIVSELSKRLEIPPERVSVQNYVNIFPIVADNQSGELFSVNEEA